MELDKTLERIEQLKHFESLLGNCINYLWEIWGNESCEDIEKSFKRLGFNEEDLGYWYIREELDRITEECK